MHLSKSLKVEYSVSLRSKSMTEVESRDFHVIFNGVFSVMPLKKNAQIHIKDKTYKMLPNDTVLTASTAKDKKLCLRRCF
jgi:hypothetical protein